MLKTLALIALFMALPAYGLRYKSDQDSAPMPPLSKDEAIKIGHMAKVTRNGVVASAPSPKVDQREQHPTTTKLPKLTRWARSTKMGRSRRHRNR